MLGDEGGLDELLLGHRLEDLGDELALAPCGFGVAAVALEDIHQLVARALEADILAGSFAGQLDHGGAAPRSAEIHLMALILHLQRAARGKRRRLDDALRELHHAFEVAERLVELHGGELGVMIRIHALVAELAPDLEDLLEAAHQQALEMQLGGDAQVEVLVQRVVVRDEGTRVRAAEDGVQDGRLHLVVAVILHVAADGGNHLEALLERVAHLAVHDEVDIALAIARLLVGQAVELLRQGAQRLAEQLERCHGHGQLPALRAHHRALDADPVAHVQVLELGERVLAQRVDAAEQLHVARGVAQLEESQLALIALRHDAAGDLHLVLGGRAVLEVGVLFGQVGQVVRVRERMAVRVLARCHQRLALSAAHGDGVVFDDLLGGVDGIAH